MASHQGPEYSQRGFGLVEVLIAVAILSVLGLGISSLITDMFRMQKKANAVSAITQMRSLIISAVQNGEAWSRTAEISRNPLMTCMHPVAPSVCTESAAGTSLDLFDPGGIAIFQALAPGNGFLANGTLCTGYPSDACPFSWDLRWIADCAGGGDGTTCMTPTIRVTGSLEYNNGSDPLPGGFNPDNYRIDVLRGAEAIRNDPVVVVYQDNTANGETGSCKGAFIRRQLNLVRQDNGNNLLNKTGTAVSGNEMRLRAGTYNCRVTVPGFKNGGNRIKIVPTLGTPFTEITSATNVAALTGGSVVSSIDTTLVLMQDTTFHIEHYCTSNYTDSSTPPNTPPYFGHGSASPANDWTLGAPIASPDYSAVVYTTVSCSRTS